MVEIWGEMYGQSMETMASPALIVGVHLMTDTLRDSIAAITRAQKSS